MKFSYFVPASTQILLWDISYGNYPSTFNALAAEPDAEPHEDIVAAMQHQEVQQGVIEPVESVQTPVAQAQVLPEPEGEAQAKEEAESSAVQVTAADEALGLSLEAEQTLIEGHLIIDDADVEINFSDVVADEQSVEVIDITGTGDNTLNLTLGDILAHGEKDLFVADGTVQMMIKGDEGDVVNLDDLVNGNDPGDWAKASDMVEVAGVRYQVFTHSTHDAELLVQEGVQTNLI